MRYLVATVNVTSLWSWTTLESCGSRRLHWMTSPWRHSLHCWRSEKSQVYQSNWACSGRNFDLKSLDLIIKIKTWNLTKWFGQYSVCKTRNSCDKPCYVIPRSGSFAFLVSYDSYESQLSIDTRSDSTIVRMNESSQFHWDGPKCICCQTFSNHVPLFKIVNKEDFEFLIKSESWIDLGLFIQSPPCISQHLILRKVREWTV
jgi:hypothetical protein